MICQPATAAMMPNPIRFTAVQATHKTTYLRIQVIQSTERLARATPAMYHKGAEVTIPNTSTVNRVTSMKGNESTHDVGAAMRNSTVAARVAAKSFRSPPRRKPTLIDTMMRIVG